MQDRRRRLIFLITILSVLCLGLFPAQGLANTQVITPTIKKVKPLNPITVEIGSNAERMLPYYAEVEYHNGQKGTRKVTWDRVYTNEPGTERVNGRVEGTSQPVQLYVFVVERGGGTLPCPCDDDRDKDKDKDRDGDRDKDRDDDRYRPDPGDDHDTTPTPGTPDGDPIRDIIIRYSTFITVFEVTSSSSRVAKMTLNGTEMIYQGNNKFHLSRSGVKKGETITIIAYDSAGKEVDRQTRVVQ